jgi:hypothetical protein
LRDGVPIDDKTWTDLLEAARCVGLDAARAKAIAGIGASVQQ